MERQLICPIDEHELVCHCGEDMGTWHDGHSATLMGCANCRRDQAELLEQRRATEADQ